MPHRPKSPVPPLATAVLENWGRTVRETRVSRGLTQASLGRQCGVSRDTILTIEAGRPVESWALALVAHYLGLPMKKPRP